MYRKFNKLDFVFLVFFIVDWNLRMSLCHSFWAINVRGYPGRILVGVNKLELNSGGGKIPFFPRNAYYPLKNYLFRKICQPGQLPPLCSLGYAYVNVHPLSTYEYTVSKMRSHFDSRYNTFIIVFLSLRIERAFHWVNVLLIRMRQIYT